MLYITTSMFLHLNPQSGLPVYRQMIQQLKERIASGQLAPDTQLPSVRDLSAELHINPLTVAKAYQFLERDGFVEFRRGHGTFHDERGGHALQGDPGQQRHIFASVAPTKGLRPFASWSTR